MTAEIVRQTLRGTHWWAIACCGRTLAIVHPNPDFHPATGDAHPPPERLTGDENTAIAALTDHLTAEHGIPVVRQVVVVDVDDCAHVTRPACPAGCDGTARTARTVDTAITTATVAEATP